MSLIFSAIEEYIINTLQECDESLLLICPFIKVAPLSRILNRIESGTSVEIITTWKLCNFAAGVSDPEIYEYCREKGFTLKAHNKIHLKTWLFDGTKLLAGSANVTDAALGVSSNPNYEFMIDVRASDADVSMLNSIASESIEVTEELFQQTVQHLGKFEKPSYDDFDIDLLQQEVRNENLVEDVPRCWDIDELFQFYSENAISEDVAHDLEKLRIPTGLRYDAFKSAVKRSFFRLPIVMRVCEQLHEKSMFFGEMKAFLQDINDSDPKPTRRELTPITQNLYRWLSSLKPDQFVVDQPNHSERITFIPTHP